MNGVITISDGVATMEDGNLTGLDTLQTNTLNSTTLTTSTPPSGSNDTTVPNTNWVYTNYAGLNKNNAFTGTNNFNTAAINETPLNIKYTGSPSQAIVMCPTTSTAGYNDYTVAGDCFIGGTSNLVVGPQNKVCAIRFTDTSLNLFSQNETKFIINDSDIAIFTATNLNLNVPFYSNYLGPGSNDYENQFVGDIWCQSALTSKNGLYIQNDITLGSTVYAMIDSSGNSILSTLSSTATTKDTPTYTTNNSINTASLRIIPVTNLASFNPIVKNNDRLLLSAGPVGSGLSICQATTNATGFRMDDSTLKFAASGAVQFWLSGAPSGSYSGFDSTGKMVLQDGFSASGVTFIDTAGILTTSTPLTTDNSVRVATTAYVKSQPIAFLSAANTFTGQNTFSNTTTFTGAIVPPKTNVASGSSIQGYQILGTITPPTGNTAQAITSVTFDGTTISFGTYFMEWHLSVNTTSSVSMTARLSTVSGSLAGNFSDAVYTPPVSFDNRLNSSGMFRIYSPITWYLNFQVPSGSYTYLDGMLRYTRVA
jgi:hypothetical protein